MLEEDILHLAQITVEQLTSKRLTIVTAESCTGGLIASALTAISGSSAVVHGGFVTYSNEAKSEMINVDPELIESFGAVSQQVACAMSKGAIDQTGTDVSIAVTGIAGPSGGSVEKPVGTVHFSCSFNDQTSHIKRNFGDIGRDEVREETVRVALTLVLACVDKG